MAINFNNPPYFDDFDDTMNYHRILYKPGNAVQARELTQSQTILQDQITKFADNIFKQNSPVTGGQITTNLSCKYIKLKDTYNNFFYDVTDFNNKLIQNADGTISATVLMTAPSAGIGSDPATLVVSYLSGNEFSDGDVIYDSTSNLAAQAIDTGSTGLSSVSSIAKGVFYVLGNFVQISDSTVILSKYDNIPSLRLGLNISESIVDYTDDPSLLDPALGASNYQAPGADRYLISLTLETRPLQFGDDDNFIELIRMENGNIFKMVDGSVYSVIDDFFAKKTYETNGDYVVNDFKLTPKTNSSNTSTYIMNVGKGLAYVHGYRVENPAPVEIISNRARTTNSQNNNPVSVNYGNYLYVNGVRGNTSHFFDSTTAQSVDLHCVDSSNIISSNANTYISTLAASGYLRGLEYSSDTGLTDTSTWTYKAFVNDLIVKSLSSNVSSATSTTIKFYDTTSKFSTTNNAYNGVTISITSGTNSGEIRTVSAYDGSIKTATVNKSWSTTPDTTSQFSLNFDTSDIESVVYANTSYTLLARANTSNSSKVGGISSGDTVIENSTVPELVFTIGNPYVSEISSTSYTASQLWRNVSFSAPGNAILSYNTGGYTNIIRHFGTPGSTLSSSTLKENYIIVVTDKKSTSLNNGDVLNWTNLGGTAALDATGGILTLTSTLGAFTADIIAKVFIENADNNQIVLKTKTLITGNTSTVNISGTNVNTYTYVDDTVSSTGQVYIKNGGLVNPGSKQSLYLSDVKRVKNIIDTKGPGTDPIVGMLSDSSYDITSHYTFDNGQNDNYYDHASITLKPGFSKPIGNILIVLDYYQHSGGDGYFSVESYINENYTQIPYYVSKHGTPYSLKDSVDFRPARTNSVTTFSYRTSNIGGTQKDGILIPCDQSIFLNNYSYYLARKDKLILTKDRSIQIIEGTPSLNPLLPTEPTGSLILANITHDPYTGFIPSEKPYGASNLSIEKIQHRRYTMQDISGIDARVNQIEYYTSLNLLEQNANSMQISDAYGLNRFKNGIMVDDFSSYSTADTYNSDYKAGINRRTRQMSALQSVDNFPLKNSVLISNAGNPSNAALSSLDYSILSDGLINYFCLPYSTSNIASQKIASRTVNINPFSITTSEGILSLSPNMDNWIDKSYAPALLITDPGLQVYQSSNTVNVITAGDWQTISSTTVLAGTSSSSSTTNEHKENHILNATGTGFAEDWGFGLGYGINTESKSSTTTQTYKTTIQQQQTNVLGPYSKINNTYSMNNGYITDISILPWMRAQEISIRGSGLLLNTYVKNYFDNVLMDNFMRKPNIIELSNVTGLFAPLGVIGYVSSGTFYPRAKILDVYYYPETLNVRLYVVSDSTSSEYTISSTVSAATFNTNGGYSVVASGTLISTDHYAGIIKSADRANNTLTISSLSTTSNNYYGISGNTVYIVSGTGIGQSADITAYNGVSKTLTVSTPLTANTGDVYSIGTFKSNEEGNYFGIFCLPPYTFHNGQRVFRIDNRTGDIGTSTTYAEGTFYSEGLSTTSQQLDFGASPSGAKGVFTQTNKKTLTSTTTQTTKLTATHLTAWDPVCQTFIIDVDNYPDGAFLSNIKIFFASKPTINKSPVTLSIVGTLNGYPNGETLDHSIVTLNSYQINASQNPQYLDNSTYTNFIFPVPVYVRPNVLYAVMLKSNSNEYTMWTAANGDTALPSSVKNSPLDILPTIITKISTAPYVGGLFISQNSQTWTADQNQSLMFVLDRCVFDSTKAPTLRMVVPTKLPGRHLIEQSIDYLNNANTVGNTISTIHNSDIMYDALNLTTTDFQPTGTNIDYGYSSTLIGGAITPIYIISPGKYATSMFDSIYLNDNNGERILIANSSSSLTMYAQLSTDNDKVSPILSDAGTSAYTIQYGINNCELSNSLITLVSGGTGYHGPNTTISISAPTGKSSSQAYGSANVTAAGIIDAVYITTPGSGYITTPTITAIDANNSPGSGASITITGETSITGGPASCKYYSKKVVLDAGFDSGDLNVYITAYRPVNTDILVYYKILNRYDNQSFDDGLWQLMTKTRNSDTLFSQTRNDTYEFSFAPGTSGVDQGFVTYTSTNGAVYTSFSQFALKVLLLSTDKTCVPFVSDIRCIALPDNINTSL